MQTEVESYENRTLQKYKMRKAIADPADKDRTNESAVPQSRQDYHM